MPTYAVLLQYEVVSGLVIEADSEDEAYQLAADFEAAAHEGVADGGAVRVSSRLWGDGTVDVEAAESDADAEELLDEWIEDLEDDSDDDEDDSDEDDDDSEDDEDDDATDELDDDAEDDDVDPDDDTDADEHRRGN